MAVCRLPPVQGNMILRRLRLPYGSAATLVFAPYWLSEVCFDGGDVQTVEFQGQGKDRPSPSAGRRRSNKERCNAAQESRHVHVILVFEAGLWAQACFNYYSSSTQSRVLFPAHLDLQKVQ